VAVLLPFLSILTVFSLDIMNTNSKISGLSRVTLFIIAGLLIASVFYPIWRIELDAPQYPEGLSILIFADKIGGDLQIVNGLNHYIGMKQIHPMILLNLQYSSI
jgi:copper chaperone NosL